MKLLNRSTTTYLTFNTPIILLAMIAIFFSIRHYNKIHVENSLIEEHALIVNRSEKIKHYFIEDELSDELIIEELKNNEKIPDKFSTVELYDTLEKAYRPFRQLETDQVIAGKNYRIIIRKSMVESSTLLYSIGVALLVLIIVLYTSSFLLTRVLERKTWSPFYSILNALKEYKTGKEYESNICTNIEEFNILDTTIEQMTKKINKDFFIYKEFINIVSHEYQTPLAVISNNVELIMQNTMLREEDYKSLSQIIDYSGKLNRLNRSLLLLSRIDNNQFSNKQQISLWEIIQQLLEEKKEQFDHKKIKLNTSFKEDILLNMDPALANILFGNLLQNAIRHNYKTDGHITIELNNGIFQITNPGKKPNFKHNEIFLKFIKDSDNKDSIGLGLSIVKSICDQYNFEIHYQYDEVNSEHHFILRC